LLLALFVSASVQQAAYDQTLAIELMHISNLAYCPLASLKAWTCGPDCQALQGQVSLVYYIQQEADLGDSLAFSMYRDDSNSMFVTAFRGTNTNWQLFVEGAEGDDVEYSTYDISDATVDSYFYNRYNTYLRQEFLNQLSSAVSNYPGYTFAFTGHSLGGALTTIAALDAILGGYLSASQTILYNYGSPRVGNFAFAQAVVQNVPVIYRVVHWNDLVPHVPLCLKATAGVIGDCIEDIGGLEYDNSGSLVWPAWHIWPQIFYTDDFSSYQTCTAEQSDCADQFALVDCSIDSHLNYFGFAMACHDATVPTTDNSKEDSNQEYSNNQGASNAGNSNQENSNAGNSNQEASNDDNSDGEASNENSNEDSKAQSTESS